MAQSLRDSTVAEQKRQDEIVDALVPVSGELSMLSQRLVATATREPLFFSSLVFWACFGRGEKLKDGWAVMKNRPSGVDGPGPTSKEYDLRGLKRLREKIEREAGGGRSGGRVL